MYTPRTTFHPISLKLILIVFGVILYTSRVLAQPTVVELENQMRCEVEQEYRRLIDETEKSLVPDAVQAIEEAKQALRSLECGQERAAHGALERAVAKTELMLGRYPDKPLLPTSYLVQIVDLAPLDLKLIREREHAAEKAVKDKHYPEGRLLLHLLQSELFSHVHHLPLATYPAALKRAAQLLEQGKFEEARLALAHALHTLVITHQTIPLPLLYAKSYFAAAVDKHKDDRQLTLQLLSKAWHELERTRELGYINRDEEYTLLHRAIEDLERQVRGNTSTTSAFLNLKEKIITFFKRWILPRRLS